MTMDERQRSSLEISDDDIDIPSFLRIADQPAAPLAASVY